MPLVDYWDQVETNIRTLEAARRSPDPRLRAEYESFIKKGTCFVQYRLGTSIAFAPSKFIGYIDNDFDTHLKYRSNKDPNNRRQGGDTNKALSDNVFGRQPQSDPTAEDRYREFCKTLGFEAKKNGTGGHPRKFWVSDKVVTLGVNDSGNAGRETFDNIHAGSQEQNDTTQSFGLKLKSESDGERVRGRDEDSDDVDLNHWLGADEADESDESEPISEGEYEPDENDRREIAEQQVRKRRGQGKFREALRARYGDRCQITGCDFVPVLEAAHIVPYRGPEDHHLENGLMLRADIHTLFDLYLLGIHPETLKVEIHGDLPEEYHRLEGKTIHCASNQRPSREALKRHYAHFCKRRRASA